MSRDLTKYAAIGAGAASTACDYVPHPLGKTICKLGAVAVAGVAYHCSRTNQCFKVRWVIATPPPYVWWPECDNSSDCHNK